MIHFANPFQLVLYLVIVGQPTLHPLPLLGPNADLLVPPSRIINGKNPRWMPLAAGTGLTALLMPDRALQQRPAQNLSRRLNGAGQFIAAADRFLQFHLLG